MMLKTTIRQKVLIILTFGLAHTSLAQKKFTISGNLNELKDGTSIYLLVPQKGWPIDTLIARSKNGKFYLTGHLDDSPEFCYLGIGSIPDRNHINESLVLFLNNSNILITGNAFAWPDADVKGSSSHDQYIKYLHQIVPYVRKWIEGREAISKFNRLDDFLEKSSGKSYVVVFNKFEEIRDTLQNSFLWEQLRDYHRKMKKYSEVYNELQRKLDSLKLSYIRNNFDSPLSPYLALTPLASDKPDGLKLLDPAKYFVPDLMKDTLMTYIITDTSYQVNFMYQNMSPTVKKTSYGKFLKRWLDSLSQSSATFAVGSKFPSFSAPSVAGNKLSFDKIIKESKLTLVDLWASGCSACRYEIRYTIKPLFDEYNTKGLSIIGFSFEETKDEWRNAIEKDMANWYQVSDLKSWAASSGRHLLPVGVVGLPHNYLVDTNGIIIAKDLRGQELKRKVEQLLLK